uniref:39S ribosomal protein L51, mitochondrial n=1 Tax=Pristionchus pacificus TaxID=54126 RepID=A0A2A6CEN7_PRIPA|eukprot:PDM76664.1 mrpl-51 [Pristionchus pacificus]
MTIILFLVDSSASMAQRNYMGCSAIDTAKAIVGDILKLRQRDINNRQSDRYMLLTTEEFPTCVKAGWKEGSQVFHEQLKALRPCGKFPLKQALMSALQFVNLNRAQTGVDYYGHGRFPHLQESVIIVTISDSSSVGDLPSDFELRVDSKTTLPGAEYTEEAFRWDQRLFSIVLRMGARAPAEPRIALAPPVSIEPGVIQRVCASTGGRSFMMTSHKQAGAVIEQLTQMIHVNGIVLRFEHPTPNPPSHNGTAENGEPSEERKAELASEKLRKALEEHPITFVLTRSRGPGHWPIPEAFWPDTVQASAKLPVRKAHPMLTIGLSPTEVQVNTDFPFDKYELDPVCALSDFVRERTVALGNGNVCWQVFVSNSYRVPGVGKPFGFLKTATNGSSVNLFLMPYNYPVLLKLLDDQKADARLRVNPDWRLKLDQYVLSCPSYYKTLHYVKQLKKGLLRLKLTGGLFDEQQQQVYAPQIVKMLNAMKTVGKEEMDKLQAEIAARIAKREAQRPISYMVDVEKRETIKPWRNFRIEWEEERKARLAAAKSDEPPEKKKGRGSRGLPMPAARSSSAVVIADDIAPDPELPEPAPTAVEPVPNLASGTNMQIDLFTLASATAKAQVYRNPFIIEKGQLAQMLPRLRINLEQQLRDSPIPALEGGLPGMSCKLQTAYELHALPVGQMGNYDEYVKQLEAIGAGPLREVEHRAMRENTFGNPFKKDKKALAVDEVGEAPAAAARDQNSNGMSKKDRRAMEGNRPPRRKAGPLALNAMAIWRERRRTNSMSAVSDLSHTADDLSDDLTDAESSSRENLNRDVDDLLADMEALGASASPSAEGNGSEARPLSNGGGASPTGSTVSRDSGVSAWGLDEEAEEEEDDDDLVIIEPSPSKKAKLAEQPAATTAAAARSVPARKRGGGAGGRSGVEEVVTLERIRHLKGEVVNLTRKFMSDDAILASMDALFASLPMRALLIMTRFARDEAERFKKRALIRVLSERLTELEASLQMLSSSMVLGRLTAAAASSSLTPSVLQAQQRAALHDRSSVPRVVDDREKRTHRVVDAGYAFRYHRQGVDALPRIPDCKVPVARPAYKKREAWSDDQARFGQNDYIDILGDGTLHPALLQFHTPRWLRGFPGQHKANELIKLIHYRNLYKEKLQEHSPRRWHELQKRIKYLLMHHNYNKQDELTRERDLGLWEEEPDYAYKDKSRRSFKDNV